MSTEQLYGIYLRHPVICTDTRKISSGCIFFALKGDNFNANTFAAEAIRLGAAYAVIDEETYVNGDRCIVVTDVLTALQDLARHHRRQLKIPFVGITGTNGKTTTKELIYAVLSTRFRTLATQGNLNNHIGVPLTVLSIGPEIEMAVIEMGANHQREIEFLCSIAMPTHGLITNVGKAHLEGFGGYEGVKKAKGELYAWLAETGGTVFLNAANPELEKMSAIAGPQLVVRYGSEQQSLVTGTLIASDPFLIVSWHLASPEGETQTHAVTTQLTGTYNLENILAASCIGTYFELEAEEINRGISRYQPTNNRSQVTDTATNRLICDYYNANPSSMVVALQNLAAMNAAEKVLILGDMFELGEESEAEHHDVLHKALDVAAARRILVGEAFYAFKDGISGAEFYTTTAEAATALTTAPIRNSTVLIKGSRGMKLEQLVELL